jgi:hypothetical protein
MDEIVDITDIEDTASSVNALNRCSSSSRCWEVSQETSRSWQSAGAVPKVVELEEKYEEFYNSADRDTATAWDKAVPIPT